MIRPSVDLGWPEMPEADEVPLLTVGPVGPPEGGVALVHLVLV
jgi:hypothetical protein